MNPVISRYQSHVHVVWEEVSGIGNEILLHSSFNHGDTFRSIQNISSNAGYSQFPDITANDTGVHIVWQDNTPGNDEIFYRKGT